MNILVIGNSFSEDSTYYLHALGKAVAENITVVNLYVPGCSLQQHLEHIEKRQAIYRYELNGDYDLKTADQQLVTIQDVLHERQWDHIVSQQASHDSGIRASYYPCAKQLFDYLKQEVPTAKRWLHETWAYELDSQHEQFGLYHVSQEEMFTQLTACYRQLAVELGVSLIKTGEVIQSVRQKPLFDYANGGLSLCRDGYHLSYVYGRYLASLVWLKAFVPNVKLETLMFKPASRFDSDFIAEEPYLDVLKTAVIMN